MNNNSKLGYLNSIEQLEIIEANVDRTKEKILITFPYPYMNGKLHLGHLYSLSRADFYAYFKKLQGYNVLFPFGFHCTGMPISASAYKLKEELEGRKVDVSVIDILKGLGFDDVEPFVHPLHWIRTFPQFAIESLKKFHTCIDWRRSFITTEINRYYDSFVRYQFNKLKKLGYLDFGKRYSIFCTIDKQPCLDHDRRKGEGVKPVEAILRKITLNTGDILLIRAKNTLPIEKVVLSTAKPLVRFEISSVFYIAESNIYENMIYQMDNVGECSEIKHSDILNSGVVIELVEKDFNGKISNVKNEKNPKNLPEECPEYTKIMAIRNESMILVQTENFIKIYEPQELVISRSGSKCTVALLDQWYIDYGLPEWKAQVKKCMDQMVFHDDTRMKLEEALEWINKWGFSRSFGLGTRIPWDQQYLIDSLSDSTIYNAFYTVKHFMFSDLEGKEEILPADCLCDDVWKFIFGDISELPENLTKHSEILVNCKESFEYFYPVDLRVSGKDLIGNHLIFFMFNHVALFDQKFWPKRIFTNGHLMLNSAKMSKSEGNYLTVEGALTRFGTSATRMCLADCGDSNEDANFIEAIANGFVLKLYTLTKSVEGLEDSQVLISDVFDLKKALENIKISNESRYNEFIDEYFIQQISKNINLCLESHENMVYRDVLKYGFYENIRLIEFYSILNGKNASYIGHGYKTILSLMYPIIPSLATYLINLKFNSKLELPIATLTDDDKISAIEHVRAICSKINSQKRDYKSVEIGVSKSYSDWKSECMKIVDSCSEKSEIVAKVGKVFDQYKINKGKGMIFCMDYFAYKSKYLVPFDEFETLSLLANYIKDQVSLEVKVIESPIGDPLMPTFIFN